MAPVGALGSADDLRAMATDIRERLGNDGPVLVALAGVINGKPMVTVATMILLANTAHVQDNSFVAPQRFSAVAVAAATTSLRAADPIRKPLKMLSMM